ncbi:MAG: prolipoprotein diacylglyceryl transferase [Spirochaetales bacterium]|nr:prolipoprotein diacylglyceryl transferase [Spirochaetales bacterium]
MLAYLTFPNWLKPEIIPGLPLRWYGLMYLVAFGITYLLFRYQIKERKLEIKDDEVMNFFFWIIIGLLVGARVIATTVYDTTGRYLRSPWLIFWPFDQNMRFTGLAGMSYHGGLIGVIIAVIVYCRVKKHSILEWGDMLVAGVPLGYTFGRLGNFINGELFGRVTSSRLGMVFPTAQRFPTGETWVQETARAAGMAIAPDQAMINLPRHPSQLYEAFFEGIVLWLLLWFVFRNRRLIRGSLVAIYIIGYGTVRFFIEYFREPDIGIGYPIRLIDVENPTYLFVTPWNFTTGQILNFLMIVGGIMFFLIQRKRIKRLAAEVAKEKLSSRKLKKKIR